MSVCHFTIAVLARSRFVSRHPQRCASMGLNSENISRKVKRAGSSSSAGTSVDFIGGPSRARRRHSNCGRELCNLFKATKDKILFMKGEESHSGSHAAHAAQWAMTGGGSLIRMGCHPLSAVLYLKQVEARARGEAITVASVTCDVGNVAACLPAHERGVRS